MKPVAFDYYAPTSVDEALDHLAQLGYDGKVLAGGQSLIPAMNFRMARPPALVDINGISDLDYIRSDKDGGLTIGTLTRDSVVEHSPLVQERFGVICEAMDYIAHPQIRNRGTFGGNIAHADPAGQLPGVTMALNARVLIRKKDSQRWVDVKDLFIGPFMTVIEPDELLVEVAIPPLPPRSGASYRQMARQHGAQFQVAVCVVVTLDKKGRCQQATVALLGVSEMTFLSVGASEALAGQEMSAAVIAKAAEAAAAESDPGNDIHASEAYRRHLVKALVSQAVAEAAQRAAGKGGN